MKVHNSSLIDYNFISQQDELSSLNLLIQSQLLKLDASKEQKLSWKESWQILEQQMRVNQPMLLFSKDASIRKEQYLFFIRALHKALLLFIQKKEEEAFFSFELPDLVGVCYTGWQERIALIQERAELGIVKNQDLITIARETHKITKKDLFQTKILQEALRLEGLSSQEIAFEQTNVHTLAILRDFAEGRQSKEPLYPFRAPFLKQAASCFLAKEYTDELIIQALQKTYTEKSPRDKERLLEEMQSLYKKALLQKTAPYINQFPERAYLFKKLHALLELSNFTDFSKNLKELHAQFLKEGFLPPFSAETPKEIAKTKLLSTPIRLAVLQNKDLTEAIQKNTELSPLEKQTIKEHILCLEQSEKEEIKQTYIRQKKQGLLALIQNEEDYIATVNSQLFKEQLQDKENRLSSFGAIFWGTVAQVLTKIPTDPLLLWPIQKIKACPLPIKQISWETFFPYFYDPPLPLKKSKFSIRQKKKSLLNLSIEKEIFLRTFRKRRKKKKHLDECISPTPFLGIQMEFLI